MLRCETFIEVIIQCCYQNNMEMFKFLSKAHLFVKKQKKLAYHIIIRSPISFIEQCISYLPIKRIWLYHRLNLDIIKLLIRLNIKVSIAYYFISNIDDLFLIRYFVKNAKYKHIMLKIMINNINKYSYDVKQYIRELCNIDMLKNIMDHTHHFHNILLEKILIYNDEFSDNVVNYTINYIQKNNIKIKDRIHPDIFNFNMYLIEKGYDVNFILSKTKCETTVLTILTTDRFKSEIDYNAFIRIFSNNVPMLELLYKYYHSVQEYISPSYRNVICCRLHDYHPESAVCYNCYN